MKIGQQGRTTKRESESEALNLKGGVNPPQRDERRQWEDWQNGEKRNPLRKEIKMASVWITALQKKSMVNTKEGWAYYHGQYWSECRAYGLKPGAEDKLIYA